MGSVISELTTMYIQTGKSANSLASLLASWAKNKQDDWAISGCKAS